jgi:hypothetical protein
LNGRGRPLVYPLALEGIVAGWPGRVKILGKIGDGGKKYCPGAELKLLIMRPGRIHPGFFLKSWRKIYKTEPFYKKVNKGYIIY